MDPFDEHIRDYTFGGIDGITVSLALLSGLSATNKSRSIIILAGALSTLSGALSMGLGDYLAIDSVKERKDIAYISGLRVFMGYFIASLIPLLPYILFGAAAFKVSLGASFLALLVFGYARAHLLNDDIWISIQKTLFIGFLTFGITFGISKAIPS